MQSVSGVDPETAAHFSRVKELARRLSRELRCAPDEVFEICKTFDEAAEFSAVEGRPLAEGIAEFLDEGWVAGAERDALKQLSGYDAGGLDLIVMSLPVMPKQAARLLRTSNEDTSAAELEKIAASDPVMTGSLLGAANSALNGTQSEVVRLLDAVMRLGIPESRRVLLAACISGLFASKPLQELWEHSQAVARKALEMAETAGVEPETAFVAGLLHDIGRLGFMRLPQRLRIAEGHWLSSGFPVAYAETLAYGVDHAAFGAEILRRWKLPEELINAVAFHHRPEHSRSNLSALLTLAEDITARTAKAPSEDLWADMRRLAAIVKTGISAEQLELLETEAPALLRASA